MRRSLARGLNGQFGNWVVPQDETVGQRESYSFNVRRSPVRYAAAADPMTYNGVSRKHQVLYREDTGEALGVVTKRYEIVKHSTFIDELDNAFEAKGLNFVRRIGLRKDGAQLRAEYRFPEVKVEVPRVNSSQRDLLDMTLHVGNSYDTTLSVSAVLGAFRIICSNGMIVGIVAGNFKRRHTGIVYVDEVAEVFGKAADTFKGVGERWAKWAEEALDSNSVAQFLNDEVDSKKLPKRAANDIYSRFINPSFGQRQGTKWGFYNAITEVASHSARGDAALRLLNWANDATDRIAA